MNKIGSVSLMTLLAFTCSTSEVRAAFDDVPYYDFAGGKTRILFVENGVMMGAPCPANKVITARDQCDLGKKREFFKLESGVAYLLKKLPRVVPQPRPLDPLTVAEVQTLLKGPPANSAQLNAERTALLAQEKDLNAIIAKFGDEPNVRKQLDSARARLKEISVILGANHSYDQVLQGFGDLVQSFFKLIQDGSSLSDLVRSKNESSLSNALAQAIFSLHVPRDCQQEGDALGDLRIGDVVTIDKNPQFRKGYNSEWSGHFGERGTVTKIDIAALDIMGCATVWVRTPNSEMGWGSGELTFADF